MSRICMRMLAFRVLLAALPSAVWLMAGHVAQAQLSFQLTKIVKNEGALSQADQKTLDEFMKVSFFPIFVKPSNADELPKIRRGYKRIVAGAPNTSGHAYLTNKVLAEMLAILTGKRALPADSSVAIKYNALLMIADLNESDETGKVKPLPASFTVLMQALGAPANMDYMKVAALVGLARFAEEGGIPKERTDELTTKLLALLNEQQPPPGRSTSAHNYLRRGAAKVLAGMGSTGPDNSVLTAFERVAVDPQARPMFRCEMARFIGELKLPQAANEDAQRLANILGHQTVEICMQEVDRAAGERRPASRRLILYALDSSSTGLQELSGVAQRGTPEADFVRNLKNSIDSLYQKIGDTEETNDEAVAEVVKSAIVNIEGTLLAKPTVTAPLVASDSKETASASK